MSRLLSSISGQRCLLAASTGGHLAQLVKIAKRAGVRDDSKWVTFDSPQSRSLLAGRDVTFVPYVAPRDLRTVRDVSRALRPIIKSGSVDFALSTGAALAAAVLPSAARSGIPAAYVESVSRFHGPSLTGKIMRLTPGVSTYTQHPQWESRRWQYEFSILEDFHKTTREGSPADPLRVFVTLGTIRPYRFDELVNRIQSLGDSIDVRWQLGATTRNDLPGHSASLMPSKEFAEKIAWSDVVVTHAGVGTALQLLENGSFPILVPRRRRRGEHVDDHQEQVATYLGRRDLCIHREVDALELDDLYEAARFSVSAQSSRTGA